MNCSSFKNFISQSSHKIHPDPKVIVLVKRLNIKTELKIYLNQFSHKGLFGSQ